MKSNIKNLILNLLLAGLCIALVITIAGTVYEIYDYSKVNVRTQEHFMGELKYENYEEMVNDMYRNEANGIKPTETMEECYAIARYYEAAVYYKAYSLSGETQKAAKKKELMEEQKALTGELAYAIEDINTQLELETEDEQ